MVALLSRFVGPAIYTRRPLIIHPCQYFLRVVYEHKDTKFHGRQLVQLVTDELGAIDVESEEDAWERPQLGLLGGSCDPNAPENGGGSWMRRAVFF